MQVTESDAVDVVEGAFKSHKSDLTTKAMALTALLKLSSRFPSCSEYKCTLIYFYFLCFLDNLGIGFPKKEKNGFLEFKTQLLQIR